MRITIELWNEAPHRHDTDTLYFNEGKLVLFAEGWEYEYQVKDIYKIELEQKKGHYEGNHLEKINSR